MEWIISRFADIPAIQILAAIPFSWMLARVVLRPLLVGVGGLCLVVSACTWWGSSVWLDHQSSESLWPVLLHQLLVTVPLVSGVLLWGRRVAGDVTARMLRPNHPSTLAWTTAMAIALLLPAIYRVSRIDAAVTQLRELQSQSRIGESVELGRRLRGLAPALMYGHEPFRTVLVRWEDEQERMINDVPHVTDRVAQARMLAMLGLREEALLLLDVAHGPRTHSADVCLLVATIYEHEQDWDRSVQWYEKAVSTGTAERVPAATLAAAWRGVGFCRRKQGLYREAERAYLRMLELEPTADAHLLLARFYQDTQAGERAARHLDAAAAVGPEYAAVAGEMRSQLQSRQFGCLQVWRTRNGNVAMQGDD